jgi:hypothetical protein
MSEGGIPQGTITANEIAQLALLFDRYEFAFDPLSRDAREAESEFEERIKSLFSERVLPRYSSVSFATFHCRAKSL